MDTTQIIVTIISSVMASSGLWGVITYIMQRRAERRAEAQKADSAERKMLIALAHDRIYDICTRILTEYSAGLRDHVDASELHNLQIMYDGYKGIGGNGTGSRLFEAVADLPVR